jgi:hypothetical protein
MLHARACACGLCVCAHKLPLHVAMAVNSRSLPGSALRLRASECARYARGVAAPEPAEAWLLCQCELSASALSLSVVPAPGW